MKDYKESRSEMVVFAKANLPTLCHELVQWQENSILPDGKLRELARLCTYDTDGSLRQAERLVEHEAIREVAGRR